MAKKTLVLTAVLVLFAVQILAASQAVTLRAGTSQVIQAKGVTKITCEDDDALSAKVLSETEVLITGKKPGNTGLTMSTAGGDVDVDVTVSGAVSGRKMIQLNCQVLEVAQKAGQTTGIDWQTLLGRSSPSDSNPYVSPLQVKENMVKDDNGIFDTGLFYLRHVARGQINLILDMLITGDHAKLLAKPVLMAASGKDAKFLAGGEVPVPMTDADGKMTVDWKEYGVQMDMTPTLSPDGSYITADMRVEVSNIDNGNAVSMGNGLSVPAMRTRWAQTSIDVSDGETIIIAGLLSSEKGKVTSEVPVLSGIPLLGELFKHNEETEIKTELVIFVTPELVTR